jgi:hypothetical protein
MAETHVIFALVDKRARLMAEIANRRFQIMRLEIDVQHLDAVIKMFRPSYDLDTILPKVTNSKNTRGVKRGTGTIQAVTVLRKVGEPMTCQEIAVRVLGRLGKPITVMG